MKHYFSEKQESVERTRKIRFKGLEFLSASGVFSKSRIDLGTVLLIESVKIHPNSTILDLGCGYGVVGLTLAKLYDVQATLADINERALKYSRINAKANRLKVIIKKSDIFSKIDEKFDSIIINPPQKAGKNICFQMITGAKEHLNEKGTLQIVARHNKGGKILSAKMKEVFGNLEVLGKKAGYRVYLSRLS